MANSIIYLVSSEYNVMMCAITNLSDIVNLLSLYSDDLTRIPGIINEDCNGNDNSNAAGQMIVQFEDSKTLTRVLKRFATLFTDVPLQLRVAVVYGLIGAANYRYLNISASVVDMTTVQGAIGNFSLNEKAQAKTVALFPSTADVFYSDGAYYSAYVDFIAGLPYLMGYQTPTVDEQQTTNAAIASLFDYFHVNFLEYVGYGLTWLVFNYPITTTIENNSTLVNSILTLGITLYQELASNVSGYADELDIFFDNPYVLPE